MYRKLNSEALSRCPISINIRLAFQEYIDNHNIRNRNWESFSSGQMDIHSCLLPISSKQGSSLDLLNRETCSCDKTKAPGLIWGVRGVICLLVRDRAQSTSKELPFTKLQYHSFVALPRTQVLLKVWPTMYSSDESH